MSTPSKDRELETVKQIILKSGVLDEHDKNVGGDLYSPQGNQELTADALAQYIVPAFKDSLKQSLVAEMPKKRVGTYAENEWEFHGYENFDKAVDQANQAITKVFNGRM